MNVASLFNLAGPDLIIILLIVLLLFGAKNPPELFRGMENAVRSFREAFRRSRGEVAEPPKVEKDRLATLNGLLVPLAIVIFLLACGLWIWGNDH